MAYQRKIVWSDFGLLTDFEVTLDILKMTVVKPDQSSIKFLSPPYYWTDGSGEGDSEWLWKSENQTHSSDPDYPTSIGLSYLVPPYSSMDGVAWFRIFLIPGEYRVTESFGIKSVAIITSTSSVSYTLESPDANILLTLDHIPMDGEVVLLRVDNIRDFGVCFRLISVNAEKQKLMEYRSVICNTVGLVIANRQSLTGVEFWLNRVNYQDFESSHYFNGFTYSTLNGVVKYPIGYSTLDWSGGLRLSLVGNDIKAVFWSSYGNQVVVDSLKFLSDTRPPVLSLGVLIEQHSCWSVLETDFKFNDPTIFSNGVPVIGNISSITASEFDDKIISWPVNKGGVNKPVYITQNT